MIFTIDNIILTLLSNFNLSDLINCSKINKQFYRISNNSLLWQKLLLQETSQNKINKLWKNNFKSTFKRYYELNQYGRYLNMFTPNTENANILLHKLVKPEYFDELVLTLGKMLRNININYDDKNYPIILFMFGNRVKNYQKKYVINTILNKILFEKLIYLGHVQYYDINQISNYDLTNNKFFIGLFYLEKLDKNHFFFEKNDKSRGF